MNRNFQNLISFKNIFNNLLPLSVNTKIIWYLKPSHNLPGDADSILLEKKLKYRRCSWITMRTKVKGSEMIPITCFMT